LGSIVQKENPVDIPWDLSQKFTDLQGDINKFSKPFLEYLSEKGGTLLEDAIPIIQEIEKLESDIEECVLTLSNVMRYLLIHT
jgi:hypothetical protein